MPATKPSPHPVRIRRAVLGMTQEELAARANVDVSTIVRIEGRWHRSTAPQAGPQRAVRRRLASALAAPQEWLFPEKKR